ncbi:hypothetical protein CcaverHIS002_0103060 [Cutaneotrichosporon cavernicola]|nr:hypothetical protein CcaverHIS002_0103060 [Cutaneotrichosporon cavernicola]
MSDSPAPEILLFARGVIALLDLWPALTIAVREGWGGHDSAEKKTFLASEIVELFDTRADRLPDNTIDPKGDDPLDRDQVSDLLAQVMSDEFEAAVEDDSLDPLGADIVRCWRDVLAGKSGGGEVEVDSEGEEWESDDEAPELVPVAHEPKERQDPVVDDDGFTLVQKPRRR